MNPEFVTKSKFSVLATRFEGFERDVLLQKNKKLDDADKKQHEIKEDLDKIRIALKEEEKRRIETMKALKSWFEDRFGEWRVQVETPIHAKLDQCLLNIDAITQRIEVVEAAVEADRRAVPKIVEHAVGNLAQQVEEFKAKYKAAEKERDRKEEELQKQTEEALHRLHQMFEAERKEREVKLALLRTEIDAERSTRSSATEIIKQQLADHVAALRVAIVKEGKSREAVQEELIQQINHYAAALQDAIKNMIS